MTVEELITQLQQFDPTLDVWLGSDYYPDHWPATEAEPSTNGYPGMPKERQLKQVITIR